MIVNTRDLKACLIYVFRLLHTFPHKACGKNAVVKTKYIASETEICIFLSVPLSFLCHSFKFLVI